MSMTKEILKNGNMGIETSPVPSNVRPLFCRVSCFYGKLGHSSGLRHKVRRFHLNIIWFFVTLGLASCACKSEYDNIRLVTNLARRCKGVVCVPPNRSFFWAASVNKGARSIAAELVTSRGLPFLYAFEISFIHHPASY